MVCHDPPWLPSCSNTHFTWYSIILTPCPCRCSRCTAAPPVRYHCTGLLPAIGVEKVATTNGPWGWWTCAQNHRLARWIESSCLSCTWNISKCASLRSPVYTRYSIDLYLYPVISCVYQQYPCSQVAMPHTTVTEEEWTEMFRKEW